MVSDVLREIFQLTGLSYFSFEDGRFRTIYATDQIKGEMIRANADGTLEDLIYPYSSDKMFDALKKSRRDHVLNSKFLEVRPCDEKIHTSSEFKGTVESMSHRDAVDYGVTVRDVFKPKKIEFSCKCEKRFSIRQLRGIWSPIILKQWGLEGKGKFYTYSTCPHLCAFGSELKKTADVNCFGVDLPEYMKPYVLSYIDALNTEPKLPDYIFDYAYFHSSIFDGSIKQVNDMRRSDGLDELDISTQMGVARHLIDYHKDVKPERIERIVETVAY